MSEFEFESDVQIRIRFGGDVPIRKFRIGRTRSLTVQQKSGRPIRIRIESRSFAGPYFRHYDETFEVMIVSRKPSSLALAVTVKLFLIFNSF